MNLTTLLGSHAELSALTTFLSEYPSLEHSLAKTTNVTFLAPNNYAIDKYNTTAASTENIAQALLDYHLLQGIVHLTDLTAISAFLPTRLENAAYSNVTDGQVVECASTDSVVSITSGLKTRAKVVEASLDFDGGVVHIIDSVLTVPLVFSSTALAANLTGFVGALDSADLTNTVETTHDITIFAPSNDAFQSISTLTQNLDKLELTNILNYHMVVGTVAYSTELSNQSLTTQTSAAIDIRVIDGAIFVNSVRIINTDILIAGGVMHIIDSVLDPDWVVTKPNVAATSAAVQFPQITNAGTASYVPFTSGLAVSSVVPALVETTVDVAQYRLTPSGSGSRATAASGSTKSVSSSAPAHHHLSTSAQAGIGVGVTIAGLLATTLAIWAFWRRRRVQRASRDSVVSLHGKEVEAGVGAESQVPPELSPEQSVYESPTHGIYEIAESKRAELGTESGRYELSDAWQREESPVESR